jgi:hypothetical protein
VNEAETYDLKSLQAWVRQTMEGLSYLGMVEAAFYSNVEVHTGPYTPPEQSARAAKGKASDRDKRQTVSWHVHLLVWGVTRAALKALVDEVSAKEPSLIEGLPSADYRRIKSEHFESKILYMLKSTREYRVWPIKEAVNDLETGEITSQRTGRFRQESRCLRGVDQVRVFGVMQERYLDRMMLGAGDGRNLLLSIRTAALHPLRMRQRYRHP